MLILPKSYLSLRSEIEKKNDFRQISILLWVDSMPVDAMERIQDLGYKALVSPLHDKDFLDDGTAKKPHYHVFFLFPGKKTFDQCQYIADYISGSSDYSWLYVPDRAVHARYLCHLDSPKKHRYPIVDLIQLNGASISQFLNDSSAETDYNLEILDDILDYVANNKVSYYHILIDYCRDNNLKSWLQALMKNLTPIVLNYMRSIRVKLKDDFEIKSKSFGGRSHGN